MKTILGWLLLAMVVVVGCGKKDDKQEKAPVRVKTEKVQPSYDGAALSYVGIVEESEATAVSFTSMGVVQRMLVNEGQAVSRGQLLAEIDPTSMSNGVTAAQATTSQAHDMVAQAQSTYDQAKDAYDRMKLLHDNGSLPEIKWIEMETKLRQAETMLKSAQSSVRSATATERIARKGLSDTRLIAPVSGIIGKRQVNAGETALPSQAVVTILNINTVKVKVSVPEAEMASITSSTPSFIRVEAAGCQVPGIHVANADHKLLPGMVATVNLYGNVKTEGGTTRRSGIFTLPVTSVHQRSDGSLFVWTIDAQNKAHRTPVIIGDAEGNRVFIVDGLAEGQQVVVEGYQKLSEGTRTLNVE